jgi:hypothetical protein
MESDELLLVKAENDAKQAKCLSVDQFRLLLLIMI